MATFKVNDNFTITITPDGYDDLVDWIGTLKEAGCSEGDAVIHSKSMLNLKEDAPVKVRPYTVGSHVRRKPGQTTQEKTRALSNGHTPTSPFLRILMENGGRMPMNDMQKTLRRELGMRDRRGVSGYCQQARRELQRNGFTHPEKVLYRTSPKNGDWVLAL